MIGFLRGTVLPLDSTDRTGSLVLDVQGVGYEVQVANPGTFGVGREYELFILTVVRPDALLLYGFVAITERRLFEALLATPGVGPTTALAALRTFSQEDLLRAIEDGDVQQVGRIPGVGAKTASRIVLELKGKLVMTTGAEVVGGAPVRGDVETALKSWGYTSSEIREALRDVALPDDEVEALKAALGLLRR